MLKHNKKRDDLRRNKQRRRCEEDRNRLEEHAIRVA